MLTIFASREITISHDDSGVKWNKIQRRFEMKPENKIMTKNTKEDAYDR